MASQPGIADPKLPALATALDPEAMREPLNRVFARDAARHDDSPIRVEVLSHKVGLRCTIRYAPQEGGSGGAEGPAVIGKLYRSRRRAERMHRRQEELGAGAFPTDSRTRLPAALLFVEELGLVLQEHVTGVDLRDVVTGGDCRPRLELAGRWLARLHVADPPSGIKVVPASSRLRRLEGWTTDIVEHLDATEGRHLERAVERAASPLADASRENPLVVIHKDFYYANLLWDGQRMWGLDLDELGYGDGAFDVGHFLAHLERHAWRSGVARSAVEEPEHVFLEAYEALVGERARRAMPFYKAYSFVKLAATEVVRRRENWREAARALAGMGRQELETFLSA